MYGKMQTGFRQRRRSLNWKPVSKVPAIMKVPTRRVMISPKMAHVIASTLLYAQQWFDKRRFYWTFKKLNSNDFLEELEMFCHEDTSIDYISRFKVLPRLHIIFAAELDSKNATNEGN